MKPDYDAIIVGARIAGSILASFLGDRGYRVLVLDKARFPSDSLSTHFFRSPTFGVLEKLAVLDQVQNVAPRLVNNFNDLDGHVFTEPVTDENGPSHYLCVRRITLDAILFKRMKQAQSVHIREGAAVSGVLRENARVTGVQWHEGNTSHQASARVVVGADGIRSAVAAAVIPAFEHSEPVQRAMYYGYFQNVDPTPGPAAEFHFRGNRLVYVFPTDGNLTLIASSIPLSEFPSFKKDLPANFAAEVNRMDELKGRFSRAKQEGPLMGSAAIPGYRKVPYGDGWALAGDSEQVMDPWSGQGIDQASTHANMLAEALIKWLSESLSWTEAMAEYHQRRNAFSVKTYERTCSVARDLRKLTVPALKKRGLIKG